MKIPERNFISNNEILFVGYSSKKESFGRMLYKEFTKAGITIYPMNPRKSDSYDIKVYNDYAELDKVPQTAYVLLSKENTIKAFPALKESGVKRILFNNKKIVTEEILDECEDRGIETATACPMMLIGGGLHKVHRFFAGLSK
ncbi:MAG: CoA-binding protein [Spirochaetaceae bacterium]|jgi:predicted CoA-binding protein|nr:CoA-binding protein [Spirochaetaceae bacterium]